LKSITGAFRLLRKPVLILRHQVLKRGAILGAAIFIFRYPCWFQKLSHLRLCRRRKKPLSLRLQSYSKSNLFVAKGSSELTALQSEKSVFVYQKSLDPRYCMCLFSLCRVHARQ